MFQPEEDVCGLLGPEIGSGLIHNKVAVGLVGCGWIARVAHMPNLVASPIADVVAIADISDMLRAEAMQRFPDARAYSDAHALVRDDAVEAVVVAVPPIAAAEVAEHAFFAGKSALLEKPGAVSAAVAQPMYRAWRKSGQVGMMGYNFRHHPSFLEAAERIAAGDIGDIVSIRGLFTWECLGSNDWRSDPVSGGVLSDLGSHHVNIAQYLLGDDIKEVDAQVRTLDQPNDTADLFLSFSCGATASLHVSSAEGRNANSILILGREGHLEVNLAQPSRPRLLRGEATRGRLGRLSEALRPANVSTVFRSGREASFSTLLDSFLRACLSGVGSEPDIEDGMRTLKVLDQARTQADQRSVKSNSGEQY